MSTERPAQVRFQVNVPLEDPHWYLALQQLVIRDGSTIPDILRPVIIQFLRRKLVADPKLAAAVELIEQSRVDAQARVPRAEKLATVAEMPGKRSPSQSRRRNTAHNDNVRRRGR
jgi:hypothetical protein